MPRWAGQQPCASLPCAFGAQRPSLCTVLWAPFSAMGGTVSGGRVCSVTMCLGSGVGWGGWDRDLWGKTRQTL